MTEEARQRAGWTSQPTQPGWHWWRCGKRMDVFRVTQIDIDCWADVTHKADSEWRGPITPDDGDREYRRGLEAAAKVVRTWNSGAGGGVLRQGIADELDRLAQEARRT